MARLERKKMGENGCKLSNYLLPKVTGCLVKRLFLIIFGMGRAKFSISISINISNAAFYIFSFLMMILGCGLDSTVTKQKTTSKYRKTITIISFGKGTAVIRYILSLWAAEVYCTIIVCFILSFFHNLS